MSRLRGTRTSWPSGAGGGIGCRVAALKVETSGAGGIGRRGEGLLMAVTWGQFHKTI